MLILINADNQIMMLLGWEGVGITSFLLIKFWSNRSETVKSSLKALLVNKIGDVFFIVFIIVTLVLVSTDSILIFDQIAFFEDSVVNLQTGTIMIMCFIIIPFTKSAQFFFSL